MSTRGRIGSIRHDANSMPRPSHFRHWLGALVPAKARMIGVAVIGPATLLLLEYAQWLPDAIVHLGGLGLAAALATISIVAYLRDGRLRLLLIASAFTVFTSREASALIDSVAPLTTGVLTLMARHPADHLVNFWILLLFLIGVAKK